jgi:uncharacterized protein
MTTMTAIVVRPWYREPFVWLLTAIPLLTVVAGGVTFSVALSSADGLVADDYYKRGLEINRDLGREQAAQALGLSVRLSLLPAQQKVTATLPPGTARPAVLLLRFAHPTRSGLDRIVRLQLTAPDTYAGTLQLPPASHWRVSVEDAEATWRLAAVWQSSAPELMLSAHRESYAPVN